MFNAIKRNYFNKDDAQAGVKAGEMLRRLPIVHVYGQLGEPLFWNEPEGTDYAPALTQDKIRKAMAGIKIVSERSEDSEELGRARNLLQMAEHIVFLGFGYDSVNLTRLNIEEIGQDKRIYGTALDSTSEEAKKFRSRLSPKRMDRVELHNLEVLPFLRETGIIGIE